MGIPRLTQDLSGYSEVAVLGAVAPPLHDGEVRVSKVVIDGPSLVYHVYDGLLRTIIPADIASAAVPTYSDVVDGVKSFLDALKSQGITAAAMLFDGSLPVSKRSVRLERMENMRKQLENFRMLHPQNCNLSRTNDSNCSAWDVHGMRYAIGQSQMLVMHCRLCLFWFQPPSMGQSFPADIPNVSVVPEEADVGLCSTLQKRLGAAILTNDSDLALYDLGSDGCVL